MGEFLETKKQGEMPRLGEEGGQAETWKELELRGEAILPCASDSGARASSYVVDQNPKSAAAIPLWGVNAADNHDHGQQKSSYVPLAQEVTTHAGFGSWLSTFRPAPTSEDEEKRNMERLEKLVTLKSQGVGGSVPPPPGPLPVVELDASEPDASGNYAVVFEGSLRTVGVAHAQLSLPPGAPVTDIIRSLHDQGFDDVLGLSPDDTPDLAVGPSTYLSNPRLITVTSGPSCYSFEKGYLINSQETFASFFNASIARPKPIEVKQTNYDLEIDGGKLRISFHRTLRVPETRGTHGLPADLGKFPLFNVANYASRMPGDMAQKGGIFLPLYQREAMYIGFDSTSWGNAPQYALKVFVGGVNAISGKTWDQKSDKQDYIVVPPQLWLDGIATAPGVVKQFVAMPLGSGYSVEKQVTGKEDTGGMQIEIVPAYNNGAGIASMLAFSGQPMPFSAARSIDPMRSPQDNGYEPGARLYMKDYRDPYVWGRPASGHPVYSRVDRIFTYDLPSAMDQDKNNQYITRGYGKPKERPAILRDLLDLSSQRPRPGIPFRIKVSHMLTIIVQHDGSLEHPIEDTFKIKCSPFAHVGQLEDSINKLINKKPALRNAEYVMKYIGMVLYRHDRTLWEHGMRDTVTVQYLCPSAVSRQQPAEVPGQTVTSRPRGLPYPSAHSLELPRIYAYGQPQSPLGPIEDSPSGVSQQHNCGWGPPPPVNERSCSWGPPPPVTERSCSWGPPSPVNEGSSRGQVISLSEGKLRERDFVPQNSKPESRGGPPTPVVATAPAFPPQMRPRKSPDSQPKRKAPGKGDVDFSGRGPVMHQFRRIKLAFDAATGEGGKTPLDDVPMMAEPSWSAQSSPPVTTVATAGLPSTSCKPTPRLFLKKSRLEPLPPENSPPPPVAPDWTSGGSVFYDMEQKEFPLPRNSAQPTPAPNWDMGIAAGGQILQYIQPDTRSRREWNLTLARVLNIQILNSVAFEACTGMLTPQTPIDTGSYNKAGLPFFRIYEEGEATVGGGFDVEIETVGQIDADKGVKMGVSVDPNNPTACVSCRVNLCDSILRHCNHTFCKTCVRDVMTNGTTVTCAFCDKRADMVLGISAPMPAPGKETPVLTHTVVLQPPRSAGFW